MLKKMKALALPMALMMQTFLLISAHADSGSQKIAVVQERGSVGQMNSSAAAVSARRENATLYNANCAICHGQAKRGQSPSLIRNAIGKNTGGMGSLKFLSQKQINAITNF